MAKSITDEILKSQVKGHWRLVNGKRVWVKPYDDGRTKKNEPTHRREPPAQEPDVISSYSRKQAVEDGELVDVSSMATEAGVRYPVALTRGAWVDCVRVPEDAEGQDEKGRLWDVLQMFRTAARGASGDMIKFSVKVQTGKRSSELIKLWAFCGPGDTAEPVITIMRPEDY